MTNNWNRLNEKNRRAAEKIIKQLADWQETRQTGKILIHINLDGIADKMEPTPSIIIRHCD